MLNQMVRMPNDALRFSPDSSHLFYAYGTFMLEKVRLLPPPFLPASPRR